ncbi:MAG TPA: ABC-type transport auxiliary lipoprotein family protein [Pseudoxanthomonas sp.]|nr:ABC-type transport auxiliary lipoprotein family protein [Pseudoxanthomonas sp.]
MKPTPSRAPALHAALPFRRVRAASLVAALCLLAGCSLLGSRQRDPVTIYSPQVQVQPDPSWPAVEWQLAIGRPSAARLVDSPRIGVRPVPGELQVYRGAVWAQPPTDLLEGAVLRALEDSGKIAAVGRQATGLRSDYRLAMDVRRFEADYASGAVPAATIEVNAKLLRNGEQRVAASRTFLQARPATATDTASVARAFEQALAAITADIAGWTLAQGQADFERHPPP